MNIDTKLEKIIFDWDYEVDMPTATISKIKQTILKELLKEEDWGDVPVKAIRKVLK